MAWVKNAIAQNMPYDEFVQALITAEGYPWGNGAVGYSLRDAGMPLDNLSNTVQVFLGTQIVCAQCRPSICRMESERILRNGILYLRPAYKSVERWYF